MSTVRIGEVKCVFRWKGTKDDLRYDGYILKLTFLGSYHYYHVLKEEYMKNSNYVKHVKESMLIKCILHLYTNRKQNKDKKSIT